jgi:hypothetical protein
VKTLVATVSFLANLALVATLALRPSLAPPAVRDFFGRHFAADTGVPAAFAVERPGAAAARPKLWAALDAGNDLPGLIARLRAAGFPANIIRDIIRSKVSESYDARIRALREPDPNTPFWKLPSTYFMVGDKRLDELNRLQLERSKVLRDLLKDDFFKRETDVSAGQRRQFGNLTSAKIDAVQRIEEDYNDMSVSVRNGTNGILLPEDREKLAYLAREKHADLATVLTPNELADYEVRSSPLTNMLARELGGFEPTEVEFRAVMKAQMEFGEKLGGGPARVDYQSREAAAQQMAAQLKASLGEARYADYVRETDRDFQQLDRVAQRENIPRETAIGAYNLRDTVVQESNRIFDEPSLTADQKRSALQSLAQNTRMQLTQMLGPVAGPAYVNAAERWLRNVEGGAAVRFTGAPSSTMTMMSPTGGTATMSMGTSPTFRQLPSPTVRR